MTETLTHDDKKVEIIIRRDNTVKQPQYYTVLRNPYADYFSTLVIFGSTEQAVINRCLRQLTKWKKESNENGN